MMGQNAPKVEESIAKIGDKLKEEPSYRSCVARSLQMCSSEMVSQIAREKDSDKACDIFDDARLKESCVNAIDTELARKTLDTKLCEKVSTGNRINCVQQATTAKAMKEKDIKICGALKPVATGTASGTVMVPPTIDNESQCIMQVITSLEITEKTLEMCKSIKDQMMQNGCTTMIQSRIDMMKNTQKSTTLPTTPSVA